MSRHDRDRATIHELGTGVYAYIPPTGSWGFSNAGLIVDGQRSMLIDTLFDLGLTRAMLTRLSGVTRAAENIEILVNTHANGDHTFGNSLVPGARVIASSACAEEMDEIPPAMLAQLMASAPEMGLLGRYLDAIFGHFEFQGITLGRPTETFDDTLDIKLGERRVRLVEVGPAHTRGDVIAYVPDARVVFTGDILFHGNHPVIWAGPVDNWIRACHTIDALDVDVVVPGHGPLAEKRDVRALSSYLESLRDACHERHAAGLSLDEAARDIASLPFAKERAEAERVYINTAAVYRELGAQVPTDVVALFQGMAAMARDLGLYGLNA